MFHTYQQGTDGNLFFVRCGPVRSQCCHVSSVWLHRKLQVWGRLYIARVFTHCFSLVPSKPSFCKMRIWTLLLKTCSSPHPLAFFWRACEFYEAGEEGRGWGGGGGGGWSALQIPRIGTLLQQTTVYSRENESCIPSATDYDTVVFNLHTHYYIVGL